MTKTDLPTRVHSAIPNAITIEEALADVAARLQSTRQRGINELAIPTHAVDELVAGRPMPDDLADRVLDARRSNERGQAELDVLRRMQTTLRAKHRDAYVHGVDHALEVLADELAAIVTDARAVLADLGDIDDANGAIAADKVATWRRAGALAERYAEVRTLQAVAVSRAWSPQDNRVRAVATPADARIVERHGHIVDAAEHADLESAGTTVREPMQLGERGGDHDSDPLPWSLARGALTALRWVITTPGAVAIVPTLAELEAARTAHSNRAESLASGNGQDRINAVIGRTPSSPARDRTPTP